MGAVDCLDTKTDEGRAFKIHYMKEPGYVMKLMAPWMTLKILEGTNIKRGWKENVLRKSEHFVYKQPFGIHFRYRHHVYDLNKRRHEKISIETTWATNHWADWNFAWYFSVSTSNANLAHGNFQKGGEISPTLQFRRRLAQELLKTIL